MVEQGNACSADVELMMAVLKLPPMMMLVSRFDLAEKRESAGPY
jgi:hypothetical protein